MTTSEIAVSALKAAFEGRIVRSDTGYGNYAGCGSVKDLITDENGRIHFQVEVSSGLGVSRLIWAPMNEWILVKNLIPSRSDQA